MTAIGPLRRFAIAAAALALGAVLFRTEIASALVVRGDDLLRAGDATGALRALSRANVLDARADAADRLAFVLVMRRAAGDAARAWAIAGRALQRFPRDASLHADRALASLRLGRRREAEREFATAAALARDARYAYFAAVIAARRGDRSAERAHLRDALAVDARYAPARARLARAR